MQAGGEVRAGLLFPTALIVKKEDGAQDGGGTSDTKQTTTLYEMTLR